MTERGLLSLKIIVYAMGIMLLGGFLWLGGRLAVKASELSSTNCSDVTLQVPEGLTPAATANYRNGDWILQARDASGTPLTLRFDRCGRLQQQVRVVPFSAAESP